MATFYSQFRHRPVGRHMISVCHGTACHVKKAGLVHDELERHLGLKDGEDTDAEGLFTVEKVACLGCCTLAPVIKIEQAVYGRLTPQLVPEVLDDTFTTSATARPARGGRRCRQAERSARSASG